MRNAQTIIFDGLATAAKRELLLVNRVKQINKPLKLVSFVFPEDEASLLYTALKKEAASRVGIIFSDVIVSMTDGVEMLQDKIKALGDDETVTGVMIQKPAKLVYEKQRQTVFSIRDIEFSDWWKQLTSSLDPAKDVDCLSDANLEKVYFGGWKILPATVKGVVETIKLALPNAVNDKNRSGLDLAGTKVVVIGRSDMVGRPLAAVLDQSGAEVRIFGSDLDHQILAEAEVVISATGRAELINRDMIKQGSVVIDVGSPGGDIDFESVVQKASFITPVPGGVGPMTVVSLLENLVEIG